MSRRGENGLEQIRNPRRSPSVMADVSCDASTRACEGVAGGRHHPALSAATRHPFLQGCRSPGDEQPRRRVDQARSGGERRHHQSQPARCPGQPEALVEVRHTGVRQRARLEAEVGRDARRTCGPAPGATRRPSCTPRSTARRDRPPRARPTPARSRAARGPARSDRCSPSEARQ